MRICARRRVDAGQQFVLNLWRLKFTACGIRIGDALLHFQMVWMIWFADESEGVSAVGVSFLVSIENLSKQESNSRNGTGQTCVVCHHDFPARNQVIQGISAILYNFFQPISFFRNRLTDADGFKPSRSIFCLFLQFAGHLNEPVNLFFDFLSR